MESHEQHGPPQTAVNVIAASFLAPWAVFLLITIPGPLKFAALLGLALFGGGLLVVARWAVMTAAQRGADPHAWGFLTVVSLGVAALFLAHGGARARQAFRLQFLCNDCGRLGEAAESFCHGCGALS